VPSSFDITVQIDIGRVEVVRLALRGASRLQRDPTHQRAKVVVICYISHESPQESIMAVKGGMPGRPLLKSV
jgi:hypothetical protein